MDAKPIRYLSVCSGIEAATVAWLVEDGRLPGVGDADDGREGSERPAVVELA